MLSFDVSREKFYSDYLEVRPYLQRGCFDSAPFSWSTIDKALDQVDPTYEKLKVVHGRRLDPSEYTEEFTDIGLRRRRLRKDKIYELMAEGATIVINRAELVSGPMQEVCLQVGRLIGAQTTGNIYATFGPQPGTGMHWDTHDVFVVQLTGQKHWEIHAPTFELPMIHQTCDGHSDEVSQPPFMQTVLNAGDVLYVPRGWWHKVSPVQGHETIHLTVAIHTPIVIDFLIWACSTILPMNVEFRRGLIDGDATTANIMSAIDLLSEKLREPQVISAFKARLRARERHMTPFDLERLVKARSTPLTDTDIIRINSRSAWRDDGPIFINGAPLHAASPSNKDLLKQISGVKDITFRELATTRPDLPKDRLSELIVELAKKDLLQIVTDPTA